MLRLRAGDMTADSAVAEDCVPQKDVCAILDLQGVWHMQLFLRNVATAAGTPNNGKVPYGSEMCFCPRKDRKECSTRVFLSIPSLVQVVLVTLEEALLVQSTSSKRAVAIPVVLVA